MRNALVYSNNSWTKLRLETALKRRPRLDDGSVPRRTLAILHRERHVAAREVVPAIAGHLEHRRARLGQVGRQNWPGGRLR